MCEVDKPDAYGCQVTAKTSEAPAIGIKDINPQSPSDVNGHAQTGDGSPREADFTSVSLADLGKTLNRLATDNRSTLGAAIAEASATGKPVGFYMDEVRAGGGMDGKTPLDQKGGIGRFSVTVSGTVEADKAGKFQMVATVRGEVDRQDYPASNRNLLGEALTAVGRLQQWIGGGKDYDIFFRGSQTINMGN